MSLYQIIFPCASTAALICGNEMTDTMFLFYVCHARRLSYVSILDLSLCIVVILQEHVWHEPVT